MATTNFNFTEVNADDKIDIVGAINTPLQQIDTELATALPLTANPSQGSTKGVTSGGVYSAIDTLQTSVNNSIQTLTDTVNNITPLDSAPTESSTKGATSGGIYTAIDSLRTTLQNAVDTLQNTLDTITPFDTAPVSGSIKGVTSGGVYDAIAATQPLAVAATRYNVACTSGNDATGDGTTDNPFQTLEGAYRYSCLQGKALSFRVNLTEAGTYSWPADCNVAVLQDLHVNAMVAGCTVQLNPNTTSGGFVFYGSHVNFAGSSSYNLTITNTGLYLNAADGGNATFQYCTIDTPVRGYSGSLNFIGCTVHQILANNCHLTLESCSIVVPSSQTSPAVNSENSFIRVSETLSVSASNTSTINRLFTTAGCYISWTATTTLSLGSHVNTFLYVAGGVLNAASGVYSGFSSSTSMLRCILVNGNQTLPTS